MDPRRRFPLHLGPLSLRPRVLHCFSPSPFTRPPICSTRRLFNALPLLFRAVEISRARTIIDNGETINVKLAEFDIIFEERERKVSFPEVSRQDVDQIYIFKEKLPRARLPAAAKGG